MYELIQHQKIDSDSANITFTNIPQNWTDLHIVMSLRGQSERMFFINFNDYSIAPTVRYLYGIGSSVGSEAPGLATAGFGSLSTDTANTFGSISLTIPNYTSSAVKSYSSDSVSESNATFSFQAITAGIWNSTAAINNIRITCRSGNIIAGSSATLYGINRTSAFGKPKAIGGNITYANGYWVHTFTGSGTFTSLQNIDVDALIVAGGGGGGEGGGGAGGFQTVSTSLLANTSVPLIVGAGGTGSTNGNVTGTNGSLSAAFSLTSLGGGYGGTTNALSLNGNSGGSGGGGRRDGGGTGGAGTTGQGNAGGTSPAGDWRGAGGGGGAGAAGSPGGGNGTSGAETGGNGGIGAIWLGNYYAGGGAGGAEGFGARGLGGLGGGGNGGFNNTVAATSGTANTGGGGGGRPTVNGLSTAGAGGSGVVIVRYRA